MIARVVFEKPIPVLGTSLRFDEFAADSGWAIEVIGNDVILYRPAVPNQNVREVPAFRVVGVGFCVALDPPPAPAPVAKARKR